MPKREQRREFWQELALETARFLGGSWKYSAVEATGGGCRILVNDLGNIIQIKGPLTGVCEATVQITEDLEKLDEPWLIRFPVQVSRGPEYIAGEIKSHIQTRRRVKWEKET